MNKCFGSAIKTEEKPKVNEKKKTVNERSGGKEKDLDNLGRNQAVDGFCIYGIVIENHYVEAII